MEEKLPTDMSEDELIYIMQDKLSLVEDIAHFNRSEPVGKLRTRLRVIRGILEELIDLHGSDKPESRFLISNVADTHFQLSDTVHELRQRCMAIRQSVGEWLGIEQESIESLLSHAEYPQALLRHKNNLR